MLLVLKSFCRKPRENERIWTPRKVACPWRPLRIRQCFYSVITNEGGSFTGIHLLKYKYLTVFSHFSQAPFKGMGGGVPLCSSPLDPLLAYIGMIQVHNPTINTFKWYQWRIQDFPDGRCQLLRLGQKTYYYHKQRKFGAR